MNCPSAIDQMRVDSRFYIDDANLSYLAGLHVFSYAVTTVSLAAILRDYEDGLYTLDYAIPYKVLIHPDDAAVRAEYDIYCNRGRNQVGTDNRSFEGLQQLRDDMRANPYDIRKGAIVIDQHNIVLEGQHRSCVLLAEHGKQHEIQVVKVRRLIRNPRTYVRLLEHKLVNY